MYSVSIADRRYTVHISPLKSNVLKTFFFFFKHWNYQFNHFNGYISSSQLSLSVLTLKIDFSGRRVKPTYFSVLSIVNKDDQLLYP